MVMAEIINSNSRVQGIYADLSEFWSRDFPIFRAENELLCHFLPKRSVRRAQYAWKESVPFPERWDMRRGRTHKTYIDRSITIEVFPYETAIDHNYYDIQDDQLGDSRQHTEMVVKRFLMILQKLVYEYFNGSASLNPALNNAWDGAAMHYATDGGGSARSGVTGGNIISSSGLGFDGCINDLYQVQQRFLDMTDTAGEQLYSPDEVTFDKFHVFHPTSLNDVFDQINQAEILRSDKMSNTGTSNVFKGRLGGTHNISYLTDNSDWYVQLAHTYWKPFAARQEEDLRSIWSNYENSDRAKEFNIETFFADERIGIGLWAPNYTNIKVNT